MTERLSMTVTPSSASPQRDEPIGYLNGAFLPLGDITINPYDLGFLRGYAVFDVMPVVNGKPFVWERYYERLCRSAEAFGLRLPVSKEEYKKILDELIARNQAFEKISTRTVLSGGPSHDAFVPEPNQETFLVLAEEAHSYPARMYEEGVKVVTLRYERPLPQAKLANHAIAIRDLPRRRKAGAFEAIYVSGGQISEATQSNLFIVKDGVLSTTWDNVLWGITQGLVLELAEGLGIVTEKRGISLEECLAADEMFITASSKHIMPVIAVDEQTIGTGIPGAMTRQLMTAFENFVKEY
ncbi:MAG: aminotransferase class IV [Candidatus Moraniibacteriota bacterium]